jgi:hypothetical protein
LLGQRSAGGAERVHMLGHESRHGSLLLLLHAVAHVPSITVPSVKMAATW